MGVVVGMAYMMVDIYRNRSSVSRGTPTAETVPATATRSATSTPQRQPTAVPTLGVTGTPFRIALAAAPEAMLFIPTAGVNTSVVNVYLSGYSWDVSDLGNRAGHLEGTAWLDDSNGNIGLAGHSERSDGSKGIFASLDQVRIGDPITLKRGSERLKFVVSHVTRVEPDDLSVLYPTSDNQRITLITCNEYNFVQDSYLERLVVMAERVS